MVDVLQPLHFLVIAMAISAIFLFNIFTPRAFSGSRLSVSREFIAWFEFAGGYSSHGTMTELCSCMHYTSHSGHAADGQTCGTALLLCSRPRGEGLLRAGLGVRCYKGCVQKYLDSRFTRFFEHIFIVTKQSHHGERGCCGVGCTAAGGESRRIPGRGWLRSIQDLESCVDSQSSPSYNPSPVTAHVAWMYQLR